MSKIYDFDKELIALGNSKMTSAITWENIADIINDKYNKRHTESFYRKRYKSLLEENYSNNYNESVSGCPCESDVCNCGQTEYADMNDLDILRKIKIEKAKLSDERVQNNAYVRALAREETLKEMNEK